MRICHLASGDLWAGAEVQIATMASYLVDQPDVTLTAVLLNEGWLARELRKIGVRAVVVDEQRQSAASILKFLIGFFKDERIDVVHTHRYKESILGTLAAKLSGVPHVVRTVHLGIYDAVQTNPVEPAGVWRSLKSRTYETLDRIALRFADRIIMVSRCMADALKARRFNAEAVTCIHNGVNLTAVRATRTRQEVRQELGIGLDDFLVATAGRLSPVKGHIHLLCAARLILEREGRAWFLFIGNGPLKNELVAAARDLSVDHRCLFVDRVMDLRSSVYDLMAAADVFALPSLDEGIPMALLEAMALERPAVATTVGGVPEIITHRATGLLVGPGDHEHLASACLELAADRDFARAIGARGREVVERGFSRERNGETLLNMYSEVVHGS